MLPPFQRWKKIGSFHHILGIEKAHNFCSIFFPTRPLRSLLWSPEVTKFPMTILVEPEPTLERPKFGKSAGAGEIPIPTAFSPRPNCLKRVARPSSRRWCKHVCAHIFNTPTMYVQFTYTHTCRNTHTLIYTHIHTYTHTHVLAYTRTYIRTYVHACIQHTCIPPAEKVPHSHNLLVYNPQSTSSICFLMFRIWDGETH